MRYKVGDKVVIVSEAVCGMNNKGLMDKWLGKTMTIQQVENHILFPYRMTEDNQEWEWRDSMIDHESTEKFTLPQRTENSGFELKKQSLEKEYEDLQVILAQTLNKLQNVSKEIKGL